MKASKKTAAPEPVAVAPAIPSWKLDVLCGDEYDSTGDMSAYRPFIERETENAVAFFFRSKDLYTAVEAAEIISVQPGWGAFENFIHGIVTSMTRTGRSCTSGGKLQSTFFIAVSSTSTKCF